MAGRALLDTNIVIALFAGDAQVASGLAGTVEVFVPVIVLGELYFGMANSQRRNENLQRLDQFAQAVAILPCDAETAKHYGRVKLDQRQRGIPLPENDLWIAALSLQHSLTVITRDKHFAQIPSLTWETW